MEGSVIRGRWLLYDTYTDTIVGVGESVRVFQQQLSLSWLQQYVICTWSKLILWMYTINLTFNQCYLTFNQCYPTFNQQFTQILDGAALLCIIVCLHCIELWIDRSHLLRRKFKCHKKLQDFWHHFLVLFTKPFKI